MDGDADTDRRGALAGIGSLKRLHRHPEVKAWQARARAVLPYLVGAAMFALAIWVLRTTLRRYDLHDLHSELASLTLHQLGWSVLFTFASFLALVGYEYSALGLVGKRMPLPHLALASFTTQSIAHSTGFAFVVGASLRYHFYSDRGLGIGDVAMVQMFFTATFTLGVATLAGGVVLVEPMRLAMATGLPPWLWRAAAGTALSLVIAYVVWGGFFHRPLRWRGRELVLRPRVGAVDYPQPEGDLRRLYEQAKTAMAQDAPQDFTLLRAVGPQAGTVFTRAGGEPVERGVPGLFTYDGYHDVFNARLAELFADGVAVVMVRPGPVQTEFRAHATRGVPRPARERRFEETVDAVAKASIRAILDREPVRETSAYVRAASLLGRVAPGAFRIVGRRMATPKSG